MTRGDRPFDRTYTLLKGLRHSGICVMYHAPDLAIRVIENVPPGWPEATAILRDGDRAIFDPPTAERVIAAKRRVLETCESERIEAAIRRDGETVWFELNLEPDCESGRALGLFVTAIDITPMKSREQVLRQLLREVSHRSRNLLAVIQGILGHTAMQAGSIEAFSRAFRGRIRSLARSQDLITHAEWRGAGFRQLAAAQLEPYAGAGRPELRVEGLDPVLAPNAALNVGLALHELAAHSALAGVLAAGEGEISITVAAGETGLDLVWQELGPAPIGAVGDADLGRTILEHVVPRALRAEARLQVAERGLRYRLSLPRDSLATDGIGENPSAA
jgi:two-component sensor histidine kinase